IDGTGEVALVEEWLAPEEIVNAVDDRRSVQVRHDIAIDRRGGLIRIVGHNDRRTANCAPNVGDGAFRHINSGFGQQPLITYGVGTPLRLVLALERDWRTR